VLLKALIYEEVRTHLYFYSFTGNIQLIDISSFGVISKNYNDLRNVVVALI